VEVAERILIVRNRHEPFERVPYVIHLLIREWQRRGIPVEVTTSLDEPLGDDVLVFPHFDLTLTPPDLARALEGCARVVNRKVLNISKRVISRQLVTGPDDYDGAVIVKTNMNYAALPELRLIAAEGGPAAEKVEKMKRQPWPVSGLLSEISQYPIFASPRDVPPRVWTNGNLVVEKFLPELDGKLFCLRQYSFLGTSEISTRGLSTKAVVKSEGVVSREVLDSVPQAVRGFREELGFDYGKFDFVLRDGEPIVFDVNRTFSFNPNNNASSGHVERLADGIHALMAGCY
jgi:hypothetical protein